MILLIIGLVILIPVILSSPKIMQWLGVLAILFVVVCAAVYIGQQIGVKTEWHEIVLRVPRFIPTWK
jgi:hypothetical protein